jgi:hypothetical protein
MKTASTTRPEAAIWERLIDFERKLSPTAARALLQLRFSPREQEYMQQLLEKGRANRLTAQEVEELDSYEQLGCLLGIVHSKARRALKKRAAGA